MNTRSLKPKHVTALVESWGQQGLSFGTQKNRLAALRWWAGKVGKVGVMAQENSTYGIGSRTYVAKTSKAQDLDLGKLARITDSYTRLSVKLQAAFGLRREEAIKFSPSYAIRDNHIQLKSTWTKGGRARSIPITNSEQRTLLKKVRTFAGNGSLIPPQLTYVQQLHRYERQLRTAGFNKLHGLRHAYAQQRYEELTGWKAPAAGGPSSKSLLANQSALDKDARETIARELGHQRESISAVYLGR